MRLLDLRSWLARGRRQPPSVPARAPPALAVIPAPMAAEPAVRDSAVFVHTAAGPIAPHQIPAAESGWGQRRLEIVERLWGEGFVLPGGAEEVLRLAAPLGLSAASSLLLLGAGGGGPVLRLAAELGSWVRAFESDPFLVAAAAGRLQRTGAALARRVSVEPWAPAHADFARRSFHHALTLDALRSPRPEETLAAIARAVRPGGQIAMLETVAPAPLDAADPAVAAWMRLEQRPLPLPDPARVGRALERLGFDVRIAEDNSARQIRLAVQGWQDLLRQLRSQRPAPLQAAALVSEAELWLRRARLLKEGRLRVVRWFAIRRLT